jgi:hypothetical protein
MITVITRNVPSRSISQTKNFAHAAFQQNVKCILIELENFLFPIMKFFIKIFTNQKRNQMQQYLYQKRHQKPTLKMQYTIWLLPYGWMDGIKVGEIKYQHAGHKSGLMCTTQMKN